MTTVDSLPTAVPALTGDASANEKLVDLYMERAVDLLRLEAGTRDKVLGFISDLEDELAGAIAKINPAGSPSAAVQQARLKNLLGIVQGTIKGTYRDVSTLMASEIREVADQEATWSGNAVNSSTYAGFADAGITRAALSTLVSDVLIQGAPSKEWWSRQAGGLAARFADEMRRGIALGESNDDLIARLRGKTGQPGFMDVSRNSAERLVRTSVQTAANAGRTAMYASNSDLIQALMWHATLDTRTTEMCMVRDGHLYDNDEDHATQDAGPPWSEGPGALHWGCRSTSIPMLKSWKDLGIDEDEIPHTTRASMDGQVPATTTFEDWLGKQSEARQDDALGAGKAALWRDGKISFRDLLNQSGRPLTTEELRAKAAS